MTRAHLFLVALACTALVPAARAQSAPSQDEVYDLATVQADHEICGFPLSDEQQDVLTQRQDALVTRGDTSESDIAAVREQVLTALRRQKDEGLCRPNGAEAQSYRRRLTGLGLL